MFEFGCVEMGLNSLSLPLCYVMICFILNPSGRFVQLKQLERLTNYVRKCKYMKCLLYDERTSLTFTFRTHRTLYTYYKSYQKICFIRLYVENCVIGCTRSKATRNTLYQSLGDDVKVL